MRYSLFLSDFDGTLIGTDGTIPAENIRAIQRYRKAGGVFAVCTGRMLSSILPRLRELGIDDGLVVAYQGAVIAEIATGKLLKDESFSAEEALSVIEEMEREKLHIHVYCGDAFYANAFYVNADDEFLHMYERICGVKGVVEEKLSEKVRHMRGRVQKVVAMVPSESRDEIQDRLRRHLDGRFFLTCSSPYLIEVMKAGQDKGSAVDFLSEYYHIPHGRIAAVGDMPNDLPMLLKAGGRFAVANAAEELKQQATVVPSCDEGGVAKAIEYAMGDIV